MRPENDTIRRKRDIEFQSRVLAALDKPKEGRLWALLNRPFTLWCLSLILLSVGGSYFTTYTQCERDADTQIERFSKIEHEAVERTKHVHEIIISSPTILAIREKLSQPYNFYPEFKDYTVRAVRVTYTELAFQINGYESDFLWSDFTNSDIQQFGDDVLDGVIPESATDADIPALRRVADITVALRKSHPPVTFFATSRAFYLYSPTCGPKVLFERAILGNPVNIVQQRDINDFYNWLLRQEKAKPSK